MYLIGLFFLLFNINSLPDFKEKGLLFFDKKGQFLIAILACLIAISPQLLLWKINSGDWLFSYDTRFERFYWAEPAIWHISYCKGWFVYTPLMFLAFFGFFFLKKKLVLAARRFLLCWTFILSFHGGLGGMAAASVCGLLWRRRHRWVSRLRAALVDWAKQQGYFIKIMIPVLISLCIVLNLFQTRQYHFGFIRWNGMTKEALWGVFGKYYLTKEEHDKYNNMFEDPSR